jgi:hypothetical protein
MTPSDISAENAEFYELFDRCNHTEAYQIARRAGFNVLPNFTRDTLIRIIIHEQPPPPAIHEIDLWRLAIMRFIIDHRRVLETQITCPARSFKEDACSGCVDAQVVHCLTSNGTENFKLIELRRKTT